MQLRPGASPAAPCPACVAPGVTGLLRFPRSPYRRHHIERQQERQRRIEQGQRPMRPHLTPSRWPPSKPKPALTGTCWRCTWETSTRPRSQCKSWPTCLLDFIRQCRTIKAMHTVSETEIFQKYAEGVWLEAERVEFINWIAANPLACDVVGLQRLPQGALEPQRHGQARRRAGDLFQRA